MLYFLYVKILQESRDFVEGSSRLYLLKANPLLLKGVYLKTKFGVKFIYNPFSPKVDLTRDTQMWSDTGLKFMAHKLFLCYFRFLKNLDIKK